MALFAFPIFFAAALAVGRAHAAGASSEPETFAEHPGAQNCRDLLVGYLKNSGVPADCRTKVGPGAVCDIARKLGLPLDLFTRVLFYESNTTPGRLPNDGKMCASLRGAGVVGGYSAVPLGETGERCDYGMGQISIGAKGAKLNCEDDWDPRRKTRSCMLDPDSPHAKRVAAYWDRYQRGVNPFRLGRQPRRFDRKLYEIFWAGVVLREAIDSLGAKADSFARIECDRTPRPRRTEISRWLAAVYHGEPDSDYGKRWTFKGGLTAKRKSAPRAAACTDLPAASSGDCRIVELGCPVIISDGSRSVRKPFACCEGQVIDFNAPCRRAAR
ncbi:MAG: hypothetical protein NTX64_04510 [Elusimicrobia bacterium]|nr:hypothetical protein [Elusimicrobiota bacterium]